MYLITWQKPGWDIQYVGETDPYITNMCSWTYVQVLNLNNSEVSFSNI